MAAKDSSPPLEILAREPEGFSLWTGPPFPNNQLITTNEKLPCSTTTFSSDGSKLLVIKSDSTISIYNSKTTPISLIKSFQTPNLLAATLSPLGTYLLTFQKATTPQEKNMVVWKVESGESVYQLFQKNMSKTTWPSIQFSSDEAVACRMATNEVQFFYGGDFSKGIVHRIRVPGIAAAELSKVPGSFVAAFVPEAKGIPASVQIFHSGKDAQVQPVARKSFFRCSTVQMSWNRGSTGLLVLAQSDVDKTNQSYYGESKLYYLTTDGTYEGIVPLSKEGPVHDARWSCSGLEFAVVYGVMPAKATVFNMKCNPLLELGTGPYNTIRWNPKGRFLCLAGFGNLPGDMAFWDYVEKKLLGTAKAEWSVTSEWSPDGHYFMTATTAPRRQIDNGIKIFHHNGSLYFKKMFDKLYQVEWKPESPERFSDISELVSSIGSLKVEDTKSKGQGSKSTQASAKATTNTLPQKPAAYRPPHAKAAAAIQSDGPKKRDALRCANCKSPRRGTPFAVQTASRMILFGGSGSTEEMSKNALRNKKRREKQREKKAAEGSSAPNGT